MALLPVFKTPGISQQRRQILHINRKRKITSQDHETPLSHHEPSAEANINDHVAAEYSTVISPPERAQRRLAGMPIDQPLPQAPFPHAGSRTRSTAEPISQNDLTRSISQVHINSLRVQHLAVMVAILHRSLVDSDLQRAARAMGLILRTQMNGAAIDVRWGGLWGICAEVLFRQGDDEPMHISRDGFERARAFYDKLALVYPPHKTWPDATNSIDFKLAMFGLWIFTIINESSKMKTQDNDDDGDANDLNTQTSTRSRAQEWCLEQAKILSDAMDQIMNGLPYMDHPEFLRLRAMVALWTADLADELNETTIGKIISDVELDRGTTNTFRPWTDNPYFPENPSKSDMAQASRELAAQLLHKLRQTENTERGYE